MDGIRYVRPARLTREGYPPSGSSVRRRGSDASPPPSGYRHGQVPDDTRLTRSRQQTTRPNFDPMDTWDPWSWPLRLSSRFKSIFDDRPSLFSDLDTAPAGEGTTSHGRRFFSSYSYQASCEWSHPEGGTVRYTMRSPADPADAGFRVKGLPAAWDEPKKRREVEKWTAKARASLGPVVSRLEDRQPVVERLVFDVEGGGVPGRPGRRS